MAEIRELQYVSWAELIRSLSADLYDGRPFDRRCYLFRGQSNEDHRLTSSFDRMYGGRTDRQALFATLLSAFRDECERHVAPDLLDDEVKAIALGQHHGLPTRLLDWTESPYVAAFFAFKGALRHLPYDGRRVAIWALHRDAPVWSPDFGVEIVTVPALGNERIRNQAGRFTLSRTPFSTLEEYVRHCDYDGVALTKIAIPAREAERSLADLAMMGVTPAQMFPDVVGAAEAAEMRMLLELAP